MKLIEEETRTIRHIDKLLEGGCDERADKLAEIFLKYARTDAAARRRAHLLLRLAGRKEHAA